MNLKDAKLLQSPYLLKKFEELITLSRAEPIEPIRKTQNPKVFHSYFQGSFKLLIKPEERAHRKAPRVSNQDTSLLLIIKLTSRNQLILDSNYNQNQLRKCLVKAFFRSLNKSSMTRTTKRISHDFMRTDD